MLASDKQILEHEYDIAFSERKDLLIIALIQCLCDKHYSDKNDIYHKIIESLVKIGIVHHNLLDSRYNVVKEHLVDNIIRMLHADNINDNNFLDNSKLIQLNNNTIYKNYMIIKEINRGAFGIIYKVKHLVDQRDYAIKRTKYSAKHKWNTEIMVLSKLDHPNIIRYYNSWIDFDFKNKSKKLYLYTQLELCDLDLDMFIKSSDISTIDKQLVDIFTQILTGVQHLHKNNILHRDLKPSNILLHKNNSDQYIVKISDLGSAKMFDTPDLHSLPSSASIGTELYAAPELLEYSHYDQSSDVYGLGLILLELSFKFKTSMEKHKIINDARKNIIPESKYSDVISKCLSYDMTCRPSIDQLITMFNDLHMI